MQFKDQAKKKAVTFSYDDGTTQDIFYGTNSEVLL